MAETIEELTIPPAVDSWPNEMRVSYYEYGDILMVGFLSEPTPGINWSVGEGEIDLRLSINEDRVIGFEIPDFTYAFLPAHPEYLEFAESAGLMADIPDRFNFEISLDDQQRSTIKSILHRFAGVELGN